MGSQCGSPLTDAVIQYFEDFLRLSVEQSTNFLEKLSLEIEGHEIGQTGDVTRKKDLKDSRLRGRQGERDECGSSSKH